MNSDAKRTRATWSTASRFDAARLYGIVMNGAEDNVYRSRLNFGYDSLRDPVHPGLDKPIIRNAVLRGTRAPHSRGVYLAAATARSSRKSTSKVLKRAWRSTIGFAR